MRLAAIAAALSLAPALAGCSSSSSVEYATDAYPSQSLVDLLKGSRAAPPAPQPDPAQTAAGAPPPAPTAVAGPAQPPIAAATAPVTTAVAAPPPPPPPAAAAQPEADPVAAAFPSVSLIDVLTGAKKPAQ